MLLRTFRCWSSFIAHLALLLVLNLLFDGPALAEQARLRSRLVELPAELEARSPWPDEATVEEALRLLTPVPSPIPSLPPGEGRPLPPSITKGATTAPQGVTASSERAVEKSPPLEVETLGGGAPLPGEGRTMGEGSGVRGPVLLASAVPPPPSLPDMPAASTVTEAPQPMAAPASAPSPDEVSLLSGWNLLSLPKQPDNVDPSAVLASISGSYQVAHAYDACSSDPWRTWNPVDPAGSSLTAIDHRIGLWVRATATATLGVSGTEPAETSIQLCQGWNLIGYPLSQPRPVLAALSSIAGRFQRIYGWDPADPADPWEVFDVAVPAWANDLELMLPGRGYWIYATADTTLVMSNTGLPPEVAITSPGNAAAVTAPADIVGTVKSDLLERWTLAYRLKGESGLTTFATGNTPVINAVLGRFDPTLLLNGLYEIELAATDFQGQSVSVSIDVIVEGNLKIGNFSLSFTDLDVPVAGLPIQVVRTYDSRDKRVGDFGVGWTLSFANVRLQEDGPAGENWRGTRSQGLLPSYCIQPTREHIVTVTLPGNQVLRFRPLITPVCQLLVPPQVVTVTYVPLPGTRASLAALDDSGEALVVGSFPGSVQLWDLSSVFLVDPGRYRVTLDDGRSLVVDQQAGLVSITDLNGNLLAVSRHGITHSSGKGISFQRDAQGRITRVIDPMGSVLSYAYDANGNLVSFTDREDGVSRYTYNRNHGLLSIGDPRGIQPVRNDYDERGRLIRHTDAFGKAIDFTHDSDARREIVTNRLGHSRVIEYDDRGNVVRDMDENGQVTVRSFDARDNILQEKDPLGNTTTYTYDVNNNLLALTDALGNRTSYTYGPRGQVATLTREQGGVTTQAYDAVGNLASVKDPLGNVTAFTYDSKGNILSEADPEGNVRHFEYDRFGNLVREIDPAGIEIRYTYDANGNRLTQEKTRTTAAGSETLVTRFRYDRSSRLVETVDPDGFVTRSVYDAAGQRIEAVDKLGHVTRFVHDPMGRLTLTIYPDGTSEHTSYDAEGRRVTQTDRNGSITRYEHDPAGRLVKTTLPDGAFSTRSYDAAGRLAAVSDLRGHQTTLEYDPAGRRTKITDASGNQTLLGYDESGNQTSITDARGNVTTFEYDASGRMTQKVFPDGTSRLMSYDRNGQVIAETDQAGRITKFGYDPLGNLISVTDALGQVTSYGHDEMGNRASQADANGHTTHFEYDWAGRQTKRTLPGGDSETMVYDAAGNLVRRTNFSGVIITYTYDSNNRLIQRTYPNGTTVSFTYTPGGLRSSMTDSRGVTLYSYDARDRLTRLTYPDGRVLAYQYDAQGNRTVLTAEIGNTVLTTRYAYDALNRLETVTDPEGRIYTQSYDANGNRASLVYPNGTATLYAYDALNRLTNLETRTSSGSIVQSYRYTLGPAGNRLRIEEHDGTLREYGHDALYRLMREKVSFGNITAYENAFEYDPVGNRLTQSRVQGAAPPRSLDYTYDSRDRMLTEDATFFNWDANGNISRKSGPNGASYTWDYDDRLVRIELASGSAVEHTYDADGLRVRTRVIPPTGPPEVTEYLVDPHNDLASVGQPISLSQVVAESDETGSFTSYHVRGNDLLATIRAGAVRFFHADGLGSIRALTDDAATVTDRYSYEAFGDLLVHEGTDPNAYLFAGEAHDPNTGYYYLRARWADISVDRFLSQDPFEGLINEPLSLHRYLYAGANPVDLVDPSGRTFVSTMLTVINILGIFLSILSIIQGIVHISEGEVLKGAVEVGLGFLGVGAFATTFKILRFAVSPINALIRTRYLAAIDDMAALVPRLRAAGRTAEEIARTLVEMRNAAKVAGRALMIEKGGFAGRILVKGLEIANRIRYGHPVGPTAEQLLLKKRTWEAVIEGALRANRDVNNFLGVL